MGCGPCKQSKADKKELRVRRMLSVTGDLGPATPEQERASDSDVGLLVTLGKEQVLQLLRKDAEDAEDAYKLAMGNRFSIISETDEEMHNVPSGTDKTVTQVGDAAPETGHQGIGYACKKGLKPESPNQDSFFILHVDAEYSIYGVFDGHGRKGHDLSNFVKDVLPKLLLMDPDLSTNPITVLANAFEKTQQLIVTATQLKHIDASRSGTTCSVIFYDHRSNTLHVAHVGDSRCVLGRSGVSVYASGQGRSLDGCNDAQLEPEPVAPRTAWEAVDLTQDHKPDNPAEKARIEAAGGKVVYDGFKNYRVYAKNRKGPGLNMSRAMGDLTGYYHAGISASPDVSSHIVTCVNGTPTADGGNASGRTNEDVSTRSGSITSNPSINSYRLEPRDKFILLCSDGVWEFLSSIDAVEIISEFTSTEAMVAADRLSSVAWNSWIKEMQGEVVDDITVVLVHLHADQVRPHSEDSPPASQHITISKTSLDSYVQGMVTPAMSS